MKKLIRVLMVLGVFGAIGLLVTGVMMSGNIDVINSQGHIADRQRDLLRFVVLLSLIVVIPVFTLLFVFSIKYREGNTKAKYRPDWAHNKWLEAVWWGIPCAIIAVLATVTWFTSHELDPYKKLESSKDPVNVQVVALQWKWLFIYPDHHVASINRLPIPVDTPINFTITADAPMNSFWIPSLGGQIYAMSGMSTKLHLIARNEGTYKGSSANISGEGFADMRFDAVAMSNADFERWLRTASESGKTLDQKSYATLAKPSRAEVTSYRLASDRLYDTIVMKYMMPAHDATRHEASEPERTDMSTMHHHHAAGGNY